MRFINICFFAVGIVLFRLLLRRSTISPRLIHLALLIFILTPLTPLVAAQINYDNLLLPLVALTMILTIDITRLFKRQEFSWARMTVLMSICLLASLVKYAFLPIFLAIFIYVTWQLVHWYKQNHSDFIVAVRAAYRRLPVITLIGMVGLLSITGGLFYQRYGINTVRYHTPIPDCSQVLSVQQCKTYGPWNRNFDIRSGKQAKIDKNPFHFTNIWLHQMMYNLSFALNGSASGYSVGKPLPLPNLMIIGFGSVGIVIAVLFSRHLYREEVLRFGLMLGFAYVVTLWLQNFTDYLDVGLPVAIQGRYLLPILIISYTAIVVSITHLLRNKQALKFATAGIVIGCLALGGGALTYILRSDPSWYWPNQNVVSANKGVRGFLRPIIPGART
ncbi:MAG: hypothetical protein NVS1B7_7430 [Candidatus Saccharimonadales bacterium]